MPTKKSSTILLIGSDATLGYLLKRYAERSGYQLAVNQKVLSAAEIMLINPAVIIFLSTELLETAQLLVKELANQDILILVCSSISDADKAQELGADHCLSHPLTYDNFYQTLATTSASKPVKKVF